MASAYRWFLCATTSSKICSFLPSASVCIHVHLLFITMYSCVSGCTFGLGQMSWESGLQAVVILQPISSVSVCYPAGLWADVCCLHDLLSDTVSWALDGKRLANGWVLIQYYCLVAVYGIVLWQNDKIVWSEILFYKLSFRHHCLFVDKTIEPSREVRKLENK